MSSTLIRILLVFSLIFVVSCESEQEKLTKQKEQQKHELESLRLAQSDFERSLYSKVEGQVKSGQGMFQALLDLGLNNPQALQIIDQLSDHVEFSKLKVGDKLAAIFNGNGTPMKFEFSNSPAETHVLVKESTEAQWQYQFVQQPTEWKTRLITGHLEEGSTLQNQLLSQGLSNSVVGEVISILLCKINFRVYARSGDQFEVLLNERHFNNEVLETKILYTSYSGAKTGTRSAYWYEDGEVKSTFNAHYTEKGEALIHSGLRYPLRRLHIRSNYGKRRHPVTGEITWHRGVDLRGQRGEPVYAVAPGVVVESEMTQFGGNKIAIKHADKSISYYLHLDKRLVKVGQPVIAHQLIGKVGATGRVTGPHLHFGFKNSKGNWINPMNKRMIATPKLAGEKLEKLQEQIAQIKKVLANTMVAQAESQVRDI